MTEPVARKVYYSIGDVCDLVGLKPHVLRYWESQFDVLKPKKNKGGNRVFRTKDLEIILLIKNLLYDEKFTIEGARRRLREMRREGVIKKEREERVDGQALKVMRDELLELQEMLTIPEA